MPLLVVRQAAGDDPARFLLLREDGKSRPAPVEVPAAQGFPVEERPQSDLMAELRWYLENFLEYPFPPETGRAERLLRALRSWGEAAFEALFGDRVGGEFLAAATAEGHDRLRLQIRSDDPRVLAWPWEALHDPRVGPLGQLCQIERRLDAVGDPPPLAANLPRDRVNVLLVTARPYEQDVAYRTISRPLVELIARHQIPARVHLLRPPTFERLREHLRQRPGFYHILHFDGHGGYLTPQEGTAPAALPAAHTFAGRVGKIAFEDERGGPDYVSAAQLAPLLRARWRCRSWCSTPAARPCSIPTPRAPSPRSPPPCSSPAPATPWPWATTSTSAPPKCSSHPSTAVSSSPAASPRRCAPAAKPWRPSASESVCAAASRSPTG